MTHWPDDSIPLICPSCGYDLRAIPSERCPECGTPIDRTAMAVSTIPWAHRKAIGRIRAYWRTLILATFRIRKLMDEINRPVNWADANRFRWITVGIASILPIVEFLIAVHGFGGTGFLDLASFVGVGISGLVPPYPDFVLSYSAGIMLRAVLPLAFILWLVLNSGLAGYWLDDAWLGSRRSGALAVGLYACAAPLGWLPISFALCGGALAMWLWNGVQSASAYDAYLVLWIAGIGSYAVPALLFQINVVRLVRHTIAPGRPRRMLVVTGFPLSSLICLVIAFGLFPLFIGFVWLMIDSLR